MEGRDPEPRVYVLDNLIYNTPIADLLYVLFVQLFSHIKFCMLKNIAMDISSSFSFSTK